MERKGRKRFADNKKGSRSAGANNRTKEEIKIK